MMPAREALERLREGNRRFRSDSTGPSARTSDARRRELVGGQAPFAVVLGCSDSRVPAELVFDQGLGDLFVIRVAGNIVASSQLGSVEFAVEYFGTRLVVVLGHTGCGVVAAALRRLEEPGDPTSRHLDSILDRILPTVRGLWETELRHDPVALARAAGRADVRVAVDHLRHGSAVLEQRIEQDGLLVVGAEYVLESGAVDFFEVPGA
jgi:carbonic anhydrase